MNELKQPKPRPVLSIPLPNLDAGLLTNAVIVAGLVAVCVAVAFLTDWRWSVLAAGVFAVFAGLVAQRQVRVVEEEVEGKVRPIRKAG